MSFVHLHTHSEYSLLDGANRIPDLVGHVKKLGMDSLAVTDHGNMHAAWAFYEEAKKQKIRPILGFEAYLAFGPRTGAREAGRRARHLQPPGAPRQEPRRLPQPHPAELHRLHRGLLPPSAHRQGSAGAARARAWSASPPASRARWRSSLRQGRYEEAKRSAEWFARVFGPDDFWLEIQKHGIAEEVTVAEGMLRLGKELGIGVVATNDAHYLRREDAEAHDVLLAIGTGADLDDPKRFRFDGQRELRQVGSGDAAALPRPPGDARQHAAGRRPLRVRLREALLPAELPPPRGVRQRRGAARSTSPPRAPSRATAVRCPRRCSSGSTTSSASSPRPATPATS